MFRMSRFFLVTRTNVTNSEFDGEFSYRKCLYRITGGLLISDIRTNIKFSRILATRIAGRISVQPWALYLDLAHRISKAGYPVSGWTYNLVSGRAGYLTDYT